MWRLRLETGSFGYVDPIGGRLEGAHRLACELTVRDGRVVCDLNGMSADPWESLGPDARGGDPRWDETRADGGSS